MEERDDASLSLKDQEVFTRIINIFLSDIVQVIPTDVIPFLYEEKIIKLV